MTKERFFIYSTVFLIMGLSNSVIPVLPEIASASSVGPGTIKYTLLFSGYFIGALLTLIPFGFIADRYSHLKLIILAISLTAISGIMLTLTSNTYLMIIARILEGCACGAFFPPAYAILAEYQNKNRYLGEFNFLLNAGLASGAVAAGFLADGYVKGAIILFTALALIVFCFGMIIPGTYQQGSKNNDQISKTGKEPHSYDIFLNETKKILGIALNPMYITTWIIAFFIFGITGVMLAYYPQYSSGMLSKPELGIVIAIVYISSMATNLIAGRLNINYRKMINSGIILAAAGVIVSIKYPLTGFTLLGIGSGIGMIGLPIAVSYMDIDKNDKGTSMGIFTTYTYMGLAFLPMIMGYFTKFGYQIMFTGTAVLMILTLLLKNSNKNNS